jgi:hypothetical protein
LVVEALAMHSSSYTVKKAFFFSFPPENSRIKDRKSRCETRTICLRPIEFFKIPHARKATAGKSRPKPQIQPENPGLLGPGGILFIFPCLKN